MKRRITLRALLAVVAISAVASSWLRSPAPPGEGQAIELARGFLVKHNEFDYPNGCWTRAEWDPAMARWRVGFLGVGGQGASMMVEVAHDHSCRSAPMDFTFFNVR